MEHNENFERATSYGQLTIKNKNDTGDFYFICFVIFNLKEYS